MDALWLTTQHCNFRRLELRGSKRHLPFPPLEVVGGHVAGGGSALLDGALLIGDARRVAHRADKGLGSMTLGSEVRQ